jgi:guanylate cyclase
VCLEIIGRVSEASSDIPFRPRLGDLHMTPKYMTDVIKECWDEDPYRRPDLKTIRAKLKIMQKGL